MISAFDQTQIEPCDEKYAAIINHIGILLPRTIQQGDKNAVPTQQQQMQHTLRNDWGRNVIVYIDNGPIFDEKPGMSPYQHYWTVRRIFTTLRDNHFYLSRKKTKLFVDMVNDGMDTLNRHVQNGVISVAKAKVDAFLALRSPNSFQELGKDLGMYNWLTDHPPWVAGLAAPLQELYHSGSWYWTANHENAFKQMKQLISGSEVLQPVNLSNDESDKPDPAKQIHVVLDASLVAGGGYVAQGKTLESAQPAVYHSCVFTPAQTNYSVYEQEFLALVDIIKSYEHWLIGRPFTAYTNSQAMLSLMKQKHLSPRQWRAVTYLSKFDIQFEFILGKKNIIADLLSRIAERSTYQHDLPYLEGDGTHLAAIQLRRGKTFRDSGD
jgi:RNase H-like domain found in reverse transcriptase